MCRWLHLEAKRMVFRWSWLRSRNLFFHRPKDGWTFCLIGCYSKVSATNHIWEYLWSHFQFNNTIYLVGCLFFIISYRFFKRLRVLNQNRKYIYIYMKQKSFYWYFLWLLLFPFCFFFYVEQSYKVNFLFTIQSLLSFNVKKETDENNFSLKDMGEKKRCN